MPKRKHINKKRIVPCADANDNAKRSLNEKMRIAAARQKHLEKLKKEYEEAMKRRETTAQESTPVDEEAVKA